MKSIKVPQHLTRQATVALSNVSALSISISSDEPYLRYDPWNDQEYYEVIDHSEGAIDESRLKAGLPLLWNHERSEHLGTANSYKIENGRCVISDITWSSSEFAQSKKKDVESGAIRSTSVGYRLIGKGKQIGQRDGIPILKFKTEIYEGSLAPVAADITVGPNRSKQDESEPVEIEILKNEKTPLDGMQGNGDKPAMANEIDAEKLAEDLKTEKQRADSAELALKEAREAHEKALKEAKEAGEKAVKDAREKAEKDAVASERQRVAGINEYADGVEKAHGFDLSEARKSHIADGKSLVEFKDYIAFNKFNNKPLPTGGKESEGKKSMKMEDFRKLSPLAQRDFCLTGGQLTE